MACSDAGVFCLAFCKILTGSAINWGCSQEGSSLLHGVLGMEACCDDHDNRRSSIFAFAQKTGLLRAARFFRVNNSAVTILCYHGISLLDEHIWRPELYLSAANFRRRLQAIRALGVDVLPLDQALDEVAKGTLTKPSVVITFDDGWHDFYSVAWPLLQEFGWPATVYQTSYYSTYNRPVFDTALSYLLWKGRDREFSDSAIAGTETRYELNSVDAIALAAHRIQKHTTERNLTGPEKDQVLSSLANRLHLDYDKFLDSRILQLMNPSEVAEVSKEGADVQLHTHRHELPSTKPAFLDEIYRNRDWIESITGKPAVHFCYPNGIYRSEFPDWLREAGVKSATTSDIGVVSAQSDLHLLPRLSDSTNVSNARFEAWLSGVGGYGSAGFIYRRLFGPRETEHGMPAAASWAVERADIAKLRRKAVSP